MEVLVGQYENTLYRAALAILGEAHEAEDVVLALPPKDRAAVHLFYYEGYQAREIAAMTGEAEGTARSRLSKTRETLKRLLT